ncbi:MAG: CAP domain-containing protein [Oscillospiraceae bacterium]|nr:CAP domain-containing protein [Oscillospiraceae bacterium]
MTTATRVILAALLALLFVLGIGVLMLQPWNSRVTIPTTTTTQQQVNEGASMLPNRRLTASQRRAWINEYRTLGGPTEFELEVVRLVNEQRRSRRLRELQINDVLMMSGRFYAQQMSQLNLGMGHNVGPYRVVGARHGASYNVVRAFGGRLSWNGGNAIVGPGTPERLVTVWMNSSGHRAYILSPEHRYIGVGRFGLYGYLFMSDRTR